MTEAYASVEQQTAWYGSDSRPGSHIPFNFVFIADITKESNATEFKSLVDEWMTHTPAFTMGQANWVLGNHDRPRIRSRFGEERYESMAVMYMMLPGIAVIYYVSLSVDVCSFEIDEREFC
jgi:alpha-glucosidase